MRKAALVIAAMLLSACASHLPAVCNEKFRADSPAIRDRVLASHPDVQPINVLSCTATPTPGVGTDPDEEACLIEITPGSVPLDAAPTSRLHSPPEVVRQLAPDLPEQVYVVVVHEGGAAVYRTLNPNQVVLYAPYMRCGALEE